MRGTMLWFNEVKDLGVILTEDGERLSVRGGGFLPGQKPKGRCAQSAVSFQVREAAGEHWAEEVGFDSAENPRRARLRHRGGVR